MTLDPVHFDGIAQLARRIDQGGDEREHRSLAETVWEEFLDPLQSDDRIIIEPIEGVVDRSVDLEEIGLIDPPFSTTHGLDAGTINPTTFSNGLVIDIAQAVMSSTPSDLDLHRSRTVIATVHSNDSTASVDDRWSEFDDGFSRSRAVKLPRLPRFAEGIVHALALYLAESEHALAHTKEVEELLVLDGPVYPRGILRWANQHPDLSNFLLEDPHPTAVLENYVRLIETFIERDIPLIGFVKNPGTKLIPRTLKRRGIEAPWQDDTAFFRRILQRGEYVDDVDGSRWVRDRTKLSYTGWFHSRGGVDRPLSGEGDALGIDQQYETAMYEVTFFVVYDPREDLCYRVEAPFAFTQDRTLRNRIRQHVLRAIAIANGPPMIIQKADELARISRSEKRSLQSMIEREFDTAMHRTYDDKRWADDMV